MFLFVVARTRLDRYEDLSRQFQDWRDVKIVLHRRKVERRIPQPTFAGSTGSDWSGGRVVAPVKAELDMLHSSSLN